MNTNNNSQNTSNFFDQNYKQTIWPSPQITTTQSLNYLQFRPELKGTVKSNIAINKNRLKNYKDKYYINNGSEFMIELFNGTNETLGVKIKLNGKYISEAHLVMYPGKTVWLERYFDSKNKFKYITYTVDVNAENKDIVKEAIQNNGDIQIEWYRETYVYNTGSTITYLNNYFTNTGSSGNSDLLTEPYLYNGDPNHVNPDPNQYHFPNADLNEYKNISNSLNDLNANYSANIEPNSFKNTSNSTSKLNNKKLFSKSHLGLRKESLENEQIETGLVGKGEISKQEFTEVQMDFEFFTTFSQSYKLLPISQKPIETKDLKLFCSHCGTKLKNSPNFCSNCGTKVQ